MRAQMHVPVRGVGGGSGRMIKGRQVLHFVDQHFKVTEADGAIVDLSTLLNVTLVNGDLRKFMDTWDSVIAVLGHEPDERVLEALLLAQIRGCEAMEQDIAYYDRLSVTDPTRNY